jgi:hypothetical protein
VPLDFLEPKPELQAIEAETLVQELAPALVPAPMPGTEAE